MYESYYGLRGKPFQLNPDPSFYFASSGHKRALAYLEYGVYQAKASSSSPARSAPARPPRCATCWQQLDRQESSRPDRQHAARAGRDAARRRHGVRRARARRRKAMLLAALEAYFCAGHGERSGRCSIVDEAQNLSRACDGGAAHAVQLPARRPGAAAELPGRPARASRDLMQSPDMQQLRQRVIASCHLGPLVEDETQAYIEHRLRHVGWNGDPHFEPRAFEAIHTLAEGVPRRINTLCNRVMLAGYLSEKHSIGAADVQSVAAEMDDEIAFAQPTELSSVRDLGPATVPHVLRRRGERSAGAVPPDDIVERLDRLERTMTVALDLLRRLSHAQNRPSSDARSHEKG